jgi:hypothetical protein
MDFFLKVLTVIIVYFYYYNKILLESIEYTVWTFPFKVHTSMVVLLYILYEQDAVPLFPIHIDSK